MIFAGYWGLGLKVGDTPDFRIMAVMGAFTGATQEDAEFLDDITVVDQLDSIGYTAYDCTSVAVTYDATANEMVVNFDNGVGTEFGTSVAVGSDDVLGWLLVVGDPATPATCRVIAFTTEGAVSPNGGNFGIDVPAGWLFGAAA